MHDISITTIISTYLLRGFCFRLVIRFWIFFNSCSFKLFRWSNSFLSMVWLLLIIPSERSDSGLDCSSLGTTGSRLFEYWESDAFTSLVMHSIPKHMKYRMIILLLCFWYNMLWLIPKIRLFNVCNQLLFILIKHQTWFNITLFWKSITIKSGSIHQWTLKVIKLYWLYWC